MELPQGIWNQANWQKEKAQISNLHMLESSIVHSAIFTRKTDQHIIASNVMFALKASIIIAFSSVNASGQATSFPSGAL